MLDKLKEIKVVDEENSNFLRIQLLEAKQYLKTDYRLHLKFESKVADHCLKYALSDEKDIYMKMLCDPYADEDPHKLICSRCEQVKQILGDIRNLVVDLREEAIQEGKTGLTSLLIEMQAELHDSENKIYEFKKYIVRSEWSNQERKNIIDQLQVNEAFLTLDFAMKWLPQASREQSRDWYGKRGVVWHITHALALINTESGANSLLQHTFVHIFESDEKQDSNHVTAIIRHVATELAKSGITDLYLRSDNAGKIRIFYSQKSNI
jgi:hypothetical protein